MEKPKLALPTLYLIRHGETEWSLSGRHTGSTDIALTPRGEEMARELAPMLAQADLTAVLTSPRLRARQTCTLATERIEAAVEPDLAEWDYGQYEGLLTTEIRQANPGWNIFQDGCPGGESLADVAARADRLLARLKAMTGNIGLFTHAHFGSVLAARWAGLAGEAAERLVLDPASISVLGAKPRYPDLPAIKRWNVVPSARFAEH